MFTIPGKERLPTPPCAACGNGNVIRVREVHGGLDLVICLDWQACIERFRGFFSAAGYAATLQAETLTHAAVAA